jgi:hypothetical protein
MPAKRTQNRSIGVDAISCAKNHSGEQPEIALDDGNNFCDLRHRHELAANCTRRVRRNETCRAITKPRRLLQKNVITVWLCV